MSNSLQYIYIYIKACEITALHFEFPTILVNIVEGRVAITCNL